MNKNLWEEKNLTGQLKNSLQNAVIGKCDIIGKMQKDLEKSTFPDIIKTKEKRFRISGRTYGYKKKCKDCDTWIHPAGTFCRRCASIGDRNGFYKKFHTDTSKKQQSIVKLGKYVGINNPNFKDGKTSGNRKTGKCKLCNAKIYYTSELCKKCLNKANSVRLKNPKTNPAKKSEAREKIKVSKMGERNPCWNGGSSFGEYSIEFNNTLKNIIKTRDNYRCQVCFIDENKSKQKFKRNLVIHHIDYNKLNNTIKNLITLCCSCHPKTNFNRHHWKKLLTSQNNRDNIII